MEFIDNTGHVFSLSSYDDNPVALQYTENDYIFWIKDNQVSINNYYIKSIKFLIDYNTINNSLDDFDLEITANSKFFNLISPKYIQYKLENLQNISSSINLDTNHFVNKLSLSDFYFDKETFDNEENTENLIVFNNNHKFVLFPFYVVAKSEIEGTFLSNIMIKYTYSTNETNNDSSSTTHQTKTITVTKEEYYDDLLKQTFDYIDIYEWNKLTNQKSTFIKRILPEYTGNNDSIEIITAHSANKYIEYENQQYSRIRNFQNGNLPNDTFHVIFKLNQNEILDASKCYCIEGIFHKRCNHCNTVIDYNHDGTNNTTPTILYNVSDNWYGYNDQEKIYKCGRTEAYPGKSIERNNDGSFKTGDNAIEYVDENNNYILKSIIGYQASERSSIPLGYTYGGKFLSNVRDISLDIDNSIEVTEEGTTKEIEVTTHKLLYNYTPITVGCTFIDECEELIINGKNMGIRLPKEILKAIYNSSFYSKYSDEKLFKNKIKELLLNYMNIKGECGNFKSMYNSLKWFGWNNHIEISKLLKTDNEFQNQYILDYFSIETDTKETFKYFNNTNIISLSVPENIETGEIDSQNYNNYLIGEGKPLLENLFDKNIEVIKDDISFYRPYYNFMFNELALKLDCLRYYYQQYFLPVHIKINRVSIEHKVYANTIKYNSHAYSQLVENPIYIPESSNNISVEFPDTDKILFCKSQHLIDNQYNEFSNYNNTYDEADLYYVNENCIVIPIKLIDNNSIYSEDKYGEYLLLDGNYVYCSNFYKFTDEETAIKCSPEEATLYRLNNYSEVEDLEGIQRFTNISSGYFNCKLYLTATIKKQDDLGHYVYINNEYLYKENFYLSDFKTISDNGNYINYYGKFIKINKENRYSIDSIVLINGQVFSYYQTINNYYKNLIVIPRILNNHIDWLDAKFRLSILVNSKWFYYDFNVITPNVYLEFGKLQYQYYIKRDNENNEYYPFKQLKSLLSNKVKFNAFMYQPDFITVDSLFATTDEYDNKQVLTFLDKLDEITNDNSKIKEFYQKYYKDKIRIPYNEKYYNRIHLFDIYKNGQKLQYNSNSTETYLYNLYADFFNTYTCDCKLILDEKIEYDYYLMHDENEWYMVVISKYPIASYIDKSFLDIHQNNYQIGSYTLKYANYSIDKFLINRMNIVKSNGFNHFDKSDLIIVSVQNNDYQFNIDLNNKWEVNKIYDINSLYTEISNTNIMIIGNNNKSNIYDIGYYNVKLNYTLAGLDNRVYQAIGEYKVIDNQNISYPVIIEPDDSLNEEIKVTKITDFKIAYENNAGKIKLTSKVLDPDSGWHPIGIKIINAGYFAPDSPAIYMGLKHLTITDPDNGRQDIGVALGAFSNNYPYFGMSKIVVESRSRDKICYLNESKTQPITNLYTPTDDFEKLPASAFSDANKQTPKWPAPNNRAYPYQPTDQSITTTNIFMATMTILNDDDTLNTDLVDETCALLDWDGHKACQEIIDSFYNENGEMICPEYADWKTVETMYNPQNKQFSPAVACAWRYHTAGTKQGDWYVPSYACVFFMIYNFKKYSEKFLQLNKLYPDYCKADLFDIGSYAFFTSTLTDKQNTTGSEGSDIWDIHVCQQRSHMYSKIATWYTIPFINIQE